MSERADTPRLFALLGDPVAHSLSPAIHNAAFEALGLEAVYVAIRAEPDQVPFLMRALAGAGGGGNVTIPHKARAADAVDEASPAVRATGACNAFYWRDGLRGDNTDVAGFRAAAEGLLGAPLASRRILLLGAGGAARAAVYACQAGSVEWVHVLNRTAENAERMVSELGAADMAEVVRGPAELGRGYDLMVNATSVGLRESDPLPLDPKDVDAAAVLDMVYAEDQTRLVRRARELGMAAADGRGMLVEQAAAAFELWFEAKAPREAMRRAAGLG